jgi:hypothetical protein
VDAGGDDASDDAAETTPDDGSSAESGAGAGGTYPEPAGAVTWDNWVSGFSAYYCVGCHTPTATPTATCINSRCHTAEDPYLYAMLFDMASKDAWLDRASTIRCGIAASQDPAWACTVGLEVFPKFSPGSPIPPDDERAVMVDWINAGCP